MEVAYVGAQHDCKKQENAVRQILHHRLCKHSLCRFSPSSAPHDPLMTLGTKAKSVIITSEYFPPVALAGLAMAFCIMGLMSLSIVFGGLVFGIN